MKIFYAIACGFMGITLFCMPVYAATRLVQHVSDGDTLILDRGERVRLIGLDAPEIHDQQRNKTNAWRYKCDDSAINQHADVSRQYLKQLIEGKSVRLEYDKEMRDKYGRTLAYVYREKDGLLVNAEIVRQGHAWAYLRFPFEQSEKFKSYQEEARSHRSGLWKDCR